MTDRNKKRIEDLLVIEEIIDHAKGPHEVFDPDNPGADRLGFVPDEDGG